MVTMKIFVELLGKTMQTIPQIPLRMLKLSNFQQKIFYIGANSFNFLYTKG